MTDEQAANPLTKHTGTLAERRADLERDIQARIADLERDIQARIVEFEDATGLRVTGLSLTDGLMVRRFESGQEVRIERETPPSVHVEVSIP